MECIDVHVLCVQKKAFYIPPFSRKNRGNPSISMSRLPRGTCSPAPLPMGGIFHPLIVGGIISEGAETEEGGGSGGVGGGGEGGTELTEGGGEYSCHVTLVRDTCMSRTFFVCV